MKASASLLMIMLLTSALAGGSAFAIAPAAGFGGGLLIAYPGMAAEDDNEKIAMSDSVTSGETEAPGQAFEHPSDDASYTKDMRDDEMLAKSKPADNGKVQYISGGVAVSGMRAIDAEEGLYNLKMLFVSEGEYLADVGVAIKDNKGNTVLKTTTKGPVLLVRMPPGRYTVSTQASQGSILTKHIKVGNDYLASYVLRYPAKEESSH